VAADRIVDSDFASGGRIDVSAIDANTSTVARDTFMFVENLNPTTNPGVEANSITWWTRSTRKLSSRRT
jgi:hypothetical protein